MDTESFNIHLNRAKKGNITAQHTLWEEVCFKQVRAYFKGDAEHYSLGYVTYIEALALYDLTKLPKGKVHRWQFPAYFSQRLRFAMQTERRTMDYPMKLSSYQVKRGELPIIVRDIGDL